MRRSVLLLGLLLLPLGAGAQTILINPSKVEFDSADHAVACPADSCISGYRVELWLQGVDPATGSPISQTVVTKTNVATTGTTPAYRIERTYWPPYPPGQNLVIRLVAVGQGGVESAKSLPTGPFARLANPASVPANVRIAQ